MSERQWHDVLAIVLVRVLSVDHDYLRQQAGVLGVQDLLDRVIDEAGR